MLHATRAAMGRWRPSDQLQAGTGDNSVARGGEARVAVLQEMLDKQKRRPLPRRRDGWTHRIRRDERRW